MTQAKQDTLFDRADMAPRRASAVRPAVQAPTHRAAERPADWRAPTEGEYACESCDGAACYALGPRRFCRTCAPAEFRPGRAR